MAKHPKPVKDKEPNGEGSENVGEPPSNETSINREEDEKEDEGVSPLSTT